MVPLRELTGKFERIKAAIGTAATAIVDAVEGCREPPDQAPTTGGV